MRNFNAFAIVSNASYLGTEIPLHISEIDDFGIPVIIESCLYEIFRLYNISPSKILIEIIFVNLEHYIQPNFCKLSQHI